MPTDVPSTPMDGPGYPIEQRTQTKPDTYHRNTNHHSTRQAAPISTDRSKLHQTLHRIRDRKARLGHHLARLLRDVRLRLHLAELVSMLAQLPENLLALLLGAWRQIVFAHGHDARYDGDDLRQVFVQCR